jgi:4-amino-4-deoxy-L-arabinose transferase-like glycosyltransferase
MAFPNDGSPVMDEVYYVTSSRLALMFRPGPIDNPPLAQLIVAISMKVLGDYWFAWRFPIVLTAVGSLYVFYLIAKRFMNERYALFGAALLSFDVVFFVHGSLYYLDMPAILFGLIGIELCLAKKYNWSAFAFGISFLMKGFGLLFLVAIFIYHIATHQKLGRLAGKANFKRFLAFLTIWVLVAGGGLWLYDGVYNPTSNLISRPVTVAAIVMTNAQGSPVTTYYRTIIFNETKGYAITNPVQNVMLMFPRPGRGFFSTAGTAPKTPWDWILPIHDYSLIPVHYYYAALREGRIVGGTGGGLGNINGEVFPPGSLLIDWQLEITPFVEYFFIPIVAVALFNLARKKDEDKVAVLLLSWMTASYGPFLLAGILIPGWTVIWHYNYLLYSIPALTLGIPYFWLTLVKNSEIRRMFMLTQLALTVVFFLYFFPVPLFRS